MWRAIGGYAADQAVNEDAEFAHRMGRSGSIWFDPSIRSSYTPRSSLTRLGRQFWRYGQGRAGTVRKHPSSLSTRQLVAPLLVMGLVSPWRRQILAGYLSVVAVAAVDVARSEPAAAPGFALALPTMHLTWGAGFLAGWVPARRRIRARRHEDAAGVPHG